MAVLPANASMKFVMVKLKLLGRVMSMIKVEYKIQLKSTILFPVELEFYTMRED